MRRRDGPQKQEVPKWVVQARAFFEASKVDLQAEDLLRGSASEGILRRRLFLLQQSLEKSSKAAILIITDVVRRMPETISVSDYVDGHDRRRDSATIILTERLQQLADSFSNPKAMGHDPAQKLRLKSILEDVYLYSRLISLPREIRVQILKAARTFDEPDFLRIISRIEGLQRTREAVSAKVGGTGSMMQKRFKSPEEVGLWVQEYALPNFVHSILQIMMYVALLSRLSDYEQSSRYPGGTVPIKLLKNLDLIRNYASKQIEYCAEFLENPELAAFWMTFIPRRTKSL